MLDCAGLKQKNRANLIQSGQTAKHGQTTVTSVRPVKKDVLSVLKTPSMLVTYEFRLLL